MNLRTEILRGKTVSLYADPEMKIFLGKGKLRNVVEGGLPYIISDTDENGIGLPEHLVKTFAFETWQVMPTSITQEGEIWNLKKGELKKMKIYFLFKEGQQIVGRSKKEGTTPKKIDGKLYELEEEQLGPNKRLPIDSFLLVPNSEGKMVSIY